MNMAAVKPRAPQAVCSDKGIVWKGKEKQFGEHGGMMNEKMNKAEYAKPEESRYPAFIEH